MSGYFLKSKYSYNLLSEIAYKELCANNPELFKTIKFKDFKKIWLLFIDEFIKSCLENPSGVDLDLDFGNISIKILDKEFKCAKDFAKTNVFMDGKFRNIPYITTDVPKIGKITWKRSKMFLQSRLSGMQANKKFGKLVGEELRKNIHRFQKVEKYKVKKSKCEPEKPVSLFDIA